ncbi:hypothetical protein N7470_009826 [Penicillium chermesinum]|nr:hypothetical protein N7470_009826 [Penicillium chermesinum]
MASNARLIAYDNDQSLTMCDTVTTLLTTAITPSLWAPPTPDLRPLNDLMVTAEQAGKNGETLQAIEDPWTAQAGLKRFDEAVDLAMTRGGGGASWKAAELKNPPALS